VAFAVVCLLVEHKEMTPSEIARALGRSISRISNVLAALRLAEVVRYDADGRSSRYRLKHPRQVRRLLDGLADFVKTSAAFRHEG
jgi:DNA-binding transcriptional ArsR family regulator